MWYVLYYVDFFVNSIDHQLSAYDKDSIVSQLFSIEKYPNLLPFKNLNFSAIKLWTLWQ
nr:hypothetical protein [uncultured Chryseobacterium sp.]